MIIIKDVPNQLGNRMFAFASVIAFAAEHNLNVLSKNFEEYKKYFPEVASDNFAGLNIKTHLSRFASVDYLATKFLRVLIRIQKKKSLPGCIYLEDIARGDLDLLVQNAKKTYLFVDSWEFPISTDLFQKHAATLRKIFSPDRTRQRNVSELIAKQRKQGENTLLVGVHRRLGDYNTFHNGNYFYSDEIYLDKMKMLKQEAEKLSNSISFVITSNEKFDVSAFPQVNVVVCTGDFVEDLYTLAACDYIFGPPSTFSQWAAFYGNKPLYLLKRKDEKFLLADFSPIIAQNKFANGSTFTHV